MEFLFLFLTWGDSGVRPLAIVSRALEATVEPPNLQEMATFSLVREDGPFIPGSNFNLSTSATSPQRQWPLKRVPTATTYTTFRISRP